MPEHDASKVFLHDKEKNDEKTYEIEGILEQHVSGYGFLRANNYENSNEDVYVSLQNIRKYNLRRGDKVKARAKFVREGDSAALQEVLSINDLAPEVFLKRQRRPVEMSMFLYVGSPQTNPR